MSRRTPARAPTMGFRAYLGRSYVVGVESSGRRPFDQRSEEGDGGSRRRRRRLAAARLAVGAHRALAARAPGASVGVPQPAGSGSQRDGRDPDGAADGDAMERAERDRRLSLKLRAPPLSGVGGGRRLL